MTGWLEWLIREFRLKNGREPSHEELARLFIT